MVLESYCLTVLTVYDMTQEVIVKLLGTEKFSHSLTWFPLIPCSVSVHKKIYVTMFVAFGRTQKN